MQIPHTIIENYLQSRFKNHQVAGREFLVDSIFVQDSKKHMSINMDTGLWQDFKASESGNFPQLVSYVDSVSVDSAVKFLRAQMFSEPEMLFASGCVEKSNSSLGKNTVPDLFKEFKKLDISKINPADLNERLAYKFISERQLFKWDFYIAKTGKYANRIIIPYVHGDKPFFFQGRNLSRFGMKYLNPSRENGGVKSSDVLFPFNTNSDYVFVTEGPLDAISLRIHGFNATSTQGSHMSYEQARQLKGRKVIFAYDSDDAGKEGIAKGAKMLLNRNHNSVYTLQLPEGFKDWNEVHVAYTNEEFNNHVNSSIKKMDLSFTVNERLK